MAAKELQLSHEYRETGFDGKYERDTYKTLTVDGANVTLEVRIDRREGIGETKTERRRHSISVDALVALIEKNGERVE